MEFYIDVIGASVCDIRGIRNLCVLKGYKFVPNNCGYYYINTTTKECKGVKEKELNIPSINYSYSYKKLKLLLSNKGEIL